MTRDELIAYCLGKPGAWLDEPWEGDQVAKVGDKIFAFFGPDDDQPRVGLKCGADRDAADELCARYPGDVEASRYTGKYGWNTISLTGAIDGEELRELVDASYDAVVSRLPRRQRP